MNSKALSVLVVGIVILLGLMLFMGRTVAPTDVDVATSTPAETLGDVGTEDMDADVVQVSIDASNFEFSKETIVVERGQTVRITLNNTQGVHDLRIEGYDVGTEVIQTGESETFEFVASEAGTFEYYCSVGSHRQMGMIGTLTVTE